MGIDYSVCEMVKTGNLKNEAHVQNDLIETKTNLIARLTANFRLPAIERLKERVKVDYNYHKELLALAKTAEEVEAVMHVGRRVLTALNSILDNIQLARNIRRQ